MIKDLLTQTCHIDVDEFGDVIVYDQCTENPNNLSEDNFLCVLLKKLATAFKSVMLLKGKFATYTYSKTCKKQPLSKRPKVGYRLMQVVSIAECSEHFVLSIFEWLFYTGFTIFAKV